MTVLRYIERNPLRAGLVNPVPRTYVRGFGAMPFGEVQNIHPRTHVRGVLWYGVNRAEDWSWSNLTSWMTDNQSRIVQPGLVPRSDDWASWVNQPLTIGELEQVRQSVNRGTPYGSDDWVARTAEQLGLEASLRMIGRPRKRAYDGVRSIIVALRPDHI